MPLAMSDRLRPICSVVHDASPSRTTATHCLADDGLYACGVEQVAFLTPIIARMIVLLLRAIRKPTWTADGDPFGRHRLYHCCFKVTEVWRDFR